MHTHTRNAGAPLTAPARRRTTVLCEITIGAIVVMITAGPAMLAAAYAQFDEGVVIAVRVAQLAAIVAASGLVATVLATVGAWHEANDRAGRPERTRHRRHATRRRPRRRCSCPEHRSR